MGKLEGKFKTFKKKNNFLFKSYNLICKEIDYINDRKNGTSYKYYLDTNSFDKYHKKIPQKITKYKDGKKDGYQLIFHKFDSKMWLFISQKQIEYVTDIVLENPKEYCKIVQRLILWNNGKKVVENFYSPNDNGFQSKTIYYKEGKIERMLIYTNNGELKRIIEESIVDDKEEFVKCIKYSPKYHITDSGEHIHHNDEIISQEIFRLRDFKKF